MRAAVLAALLASAIAAPSASGAEFGIDSFTVKALDAGGEPEDRAAAHPDRMAIDFILGVAETGTTAAELAFEFPPGFGGDPGAVPECPRQLFEEEGAECPPETQVGTIAIGSEGLGPALPIFRLEPRPGEIAAFGSSSDLDVDLTMEFRPDDFGITFRASNLPEVDVSEGHVELWGVPADHQVGTDIPRLPFLTLPTRCGPLAVTFLARSRQPGAQWVSAEDEADAPLTGCESLAFAPQLGFQLDNPRADSPTGARIDLSMSGSDDPDELAGAQLRSATIELPEGVAVSPGGAAGLTACSDAQLGLGSSTPAACPPGSKVGAAEVVSPVLPEPLTGDLYLGEERPGERFRLLIAAQGPGMVVKFVSALRVDPATGRLSTVLTDLPQVPLSRMTLSIGGGARALLASPLGCGSFASSGRFDPYGGGASVEARVAVTIAAGAGGAPCQSPLPFAPGLVAASSSHAAGRTTSFAMTMLRRGGEQLTRRFAVSLPAGLSAALGAVESCPEAVAASGACPPASRIGGAQAVAGSGASLATLDGDLYVAGPYRRAPFSLVMAFRAALGPFDLGRLAVRTAVQVNPRSGRITIATDPLPALIDGIPVRIQTIRMVVDRPGLIRNPTSCAQQSFDASFEGDGGGLAAATSAFSATGCRRLGLAPRFQLALTHRSQLRRRGKPGLRIAARFRPGDAGLRSMHVLLPRVLSFGTSGLDEICPRRDAVNGLCSPRARVGAASARSSILKGPLRGSVYVVEPEGNGLPDLWISIASKGLNLVVRGKTAMRDGRLITRLVGLPDMPLSSFEMRLRGGANGALSLRADPCARGEGQRLAAQIDAKGQNGAQRRRQLRAKAHCG